MVVKWLKMSLMNLNNDKKKNSIPLEYAIGVCSGEVSACHWVRQACKRHFDLLDNRYEKGVFFDEQAGLKAIRFIEKLKHTKGPMAGKPFLLEPWQQFIVWSVFGWKRADGSRLFRKAYIEVARKNGKTMLASGIGLYMLRADGESRGEVYVAATTRDQARICFGDAAEIVKKTALKNTLTVLRNAVVYEAKGGKLEALSSDDGTQDGWNPSCAIVDEYHAHKTSGMYDVLVSGMGARSQPLMFVITTAGSNKSGPCYAYRDNVKKVLDGVNEDDSLFGIIYTLDNQDDWDNPTKWHLANPNLDVSVKSDYIEEQVRDAKNRPEAVRNVMTKNLNLWVDSDNTWIVDEKWMACIGDHRELEGKKAWGGLDLSNTSDVTAYVLLFNEGGKFQLLPFFWIPEDTMREKVRKENINYDSWVRDGYVKVTPGNVIDYEYVKADITKLHELYRVESTAYDRWNSSQIVTELQNEGMKLTPIGMTYGALSAPTKQFEKLVLAGELEHGGNPVLRWMVNSTSIMTDPNGNIKPNKAKSSQKIDGVAAAINALAEWMTCAASKKVSVYEKRGMR